jgi:hypothetical protein
MLRLPNDLRLTQGLSERAHVIVQYAKQGSRKPAKELDTNVNVGAAMQHLQKI